MLKSLKDMSEDEIKNFMVEHNLLNMAQIGNEVGLSRERIRQIFKDKNINIFDLKKDVTIVLKKKDITLKGEEWKKISNPQTSHNYYVSSLGRIARGIQKKINGVEFEQKKLLKPSIGNCGRLRINLSVLSEKNTTKNITNYLHILIATHFHDVDKSKNFRVKHGDCDFNNNKYENLIVEYNKKQ